MGLLQPAALQSLAVNCQEAWIAVLQKKGQEANLVPAIGGAAPKSDLLAEVAAEH